VVTPSFECTEREKGGVRDSHLLHNHHGKILIVVLESIVKCTDVDDSVVKTVDTMKEFVSKIYKDS
jgi:hypothetical protein